MTHSPFAIPLALLLPLALVAGCATERVALYPEARNAAPAAPLGPVVAPLAALPPLPVRTLMVVGP